MVATTRGIPGRTHAEADRGPAGADAALLATRRAVLKTVFWSSLGVTATGLALGFLRYAWPREDRVPGGTVRVPAGQVPRPGEEPRYFPEGKFFLVNLETGGGVPKQFQGFAEPSHQGGVLALHLKCTHLGCSLVWAPQDDFEGVTGWFKCPCHCSMFTRAGIRVFGPAPRAMDTLDVQVNRDRTVVVRPSRVRLGGPDNPQRAVRT